MEVPAGFCTDLATLPIFVQLLLGNRDDWAEAAVIHDMLCRHNVSPFMANSTMRLVMHVTHAPKWKQILFFYGLMTVGYQSPGQRFFRHIKKGLLAWYNKL